MIANIFKESQKFTQIWIWVIVIGIFLLNIYAIIQQIVYKIPFGNNPAPDNMLFVILLLPVLLILLFLFNKLETIIDETGIHYRYLPFHQKIKTIEFKDVKSVYVRDYNAIKEYGGWGLRIGFRKDSGRAFNVKSNHGIQIELNNGKKILIGTQKPLEAEEAINTFFKK
ncbi:MAG: hypothetical protein JXR58_07985 [Bacteroidales bacterium]|nr:hypothetical protein [Bacteroidales bacterium]